MTNAQTVKKNKALLKSLGIKVSNLVSYHTLYGTTPNTFIPRNASMWFYTITRYQEDDSETIIECNTTYITLTNEAKAHNKIAWKNHWTRRYLALSTEEKREQSWRHIAEQYNINQTELIFTDH